VGWILAALNAITALSSGAVLGWWSRSVEIARPVSAAG